MRSITARFYSLFTLALLAWVCLSYVLLGLQMSKSLLFLVYLAFVIFIPGYTVISFLDHKFSCKDVIVFSFATGFTIITTVYFILAATNFLHLYPHALITVSAVFLILLIYLYKHGRIHPVTAVPDVPVSVLCLISAALTFVLLSMANLEPSLVGTRPFYHDTMNGVGLTVSASRSFPMRSLQMSSWVFQYHLGYYIYTASIMELLNISAFEAVIKLSLIPIAPLCVLAFASVCDHIGSSGKARNLQLCILTMIPSFGLIHYLYMDTLGYPFGLFMCFAALLLFSVANSQSMKINRFHVMSSLFLSAGMLAKGPLSVPFLFGICFVLLAELIKKHNLWVIPKGLAYAVPLFLSYFAIYGNSAGDSMFYYPLFTAIQTPLAFALAGKVPEWLRRTICAVCYTSSLSWILLLSLLLLFFIAIKRKTDLFDLFSISAVAVGYILLNTFKQEGSSELYFVSGVYPICFLCAGRYVQKWISSLNKPTRTYACAAALIILALSAVPDISFSKELFIGDDATVKSQATGLKAALTYSIRNHKTENRPDVSSVNGAVVTEDQYEAFCWMKENLPESAVFSDYRYSTNNKFFCASVFSERSCFLEGWGYLTMEDKNSNTDEKVRRDTIVRFFNETKEESFCMLLKQEGVGYLVFEKEITGDWELSDKYVDEVFRNSDVIVYKIHS